MKIFGIQIGQPIQKPVTIEDQVPEIKVQIPTTKKPTKIPAIQDPTLRYNAIKARGRGMFHSPEYDLSEIGRIEDTDGYVRQAFSKKTGLMFKEGWGITGPDPKIIRYVKARLNQIAQASGVPTAKLFRDIGTGLIKKSNCFLAKVRNIEASGGRVRTESSKKVPLKPVAGYFVIPAETMQYQLSGNKVVNWQQKMPNGDITTYAPRDIIHFFYDRKEGFVFGTPTLIPVIDDIRALRKIEENIELLVYQHLFPLFHYKVGTENMPAGIDESGNYEVDIVRQEIMYMPTEGSIVTPERHEIKAIGSEGRALRAEGYLEHFKKRVFAGLGVSAVDFGEGECYSNDTQTLTENGWKYHWEIDHEQERIATYNPETEEVEYHISNYKYEGHYEGDMITFKGKHVDVKVTPHHEMWVLNRFTGKKQKVYAIELLKNWNLSEFCFIDSVSNFSGISADVQIGNKIIDSKVWMDFFGWWISEGSVDRYNAKQNRYRVIISQKKLRDLDKIRTCLSKLPFNYREQVDKRDGTINFIIYSKALYQKLEPLGISIQKTITKEFLEYDSEHSRILLDSLMCGDGTWDIRKGRKSGIYYTASKQLANDVQILALQSGYSSKITSRKNSGYSDGIIYRVLITKTDKDYRILTPEHISIEKYSNTIYCYNVPNHLFLTRRNGLIGIHGNTANRATSDNMSRNLIDAIKDFQQVAEIFINEFIIKELLLESTFGDDVLDDERRCYLKFKEIDVDAQIKKEAHNADQFIKGAITHDELRTRDGNEPITIPTRQEMDSEIDTADKYPEWHKMYWKLFEEPKLLIQALDEPFSPTAKAIARSQSLEPTSADMEEAGQAQQDRELALEKERTKAKIAVVKAKPNTTTRPSKPKRKDGYLANTFLEVKRDVIKRVSEKQKLDHNWVGAIIRAQMSTTIDRLISEQVVAFRKGFAKYGDVRSDTFIQQMAVIRSIFRTRAEKYINRLTENVVKSLQRNVDNNELPTEIKTKTRAVFDTLQYRAEFIEDVEVRKAYSLGIIAGAKAKAVHDIDIKVWSTIISDEACVNCQAKNGQLIPVANITIEDLPPYHAGCQCTLHVEYSDRKLTTQDAYSDGQPEPGDIKEGEYTTCPKCGKTAIRKKDTPDIYNCRACGHSFRVVQDDIDAEKQEDGKLKKPSKVGPRSKRTQFTKCVMKAMSRLRAQHPDWDEDKLEMLAEAACDHLLQDSGDEEIEDGAKLERCVLRVKTQLRSEHPGWSEDKIKSSAFAICNASLKGK